MATRIEEKYENEQLEGELIQEVSENARIPFVLAKNAPELDFADNELSGVFVFFNNILEYIN
jgi:hypothetical protein